MHGCTRASPSSKWGSSSGEFARVTRCTLRYDFQLAARPNLAACRRSTRGKTVGPEMTPSESGGRGVNSIALPLMAYTLRGGGSDVAQRLARMGWTREKTKMATLLAELVSEPRQIRGKKYRSVCGTCEEKALSGQASPAKGTNFLPCIPALRWRRNQQRALWRVFGKGKRTRISRALRTWCRTQSPEQQFQHVRKEIRFGRGSAI